MEIERPFRTLAPHRAVASCEKDGKGAGENEASVSSLPREIEDRSLPEESMGDSGNRLRRKDSPPARGRDRFVRRRRPLSCPPTMLDQLRERPFLIGVVHLQPLPGAPRHRDAIGGALARALEDRSEEHTSELQSHSDL